VPECPVEAIFPIEDVPKEYTPSAKFNADFFSKGPGYEALNM